MKKKKIKNCAPFADSVCQINKTQTDNAKDINIQCQCILSMEYSGNYLKTSGSLWKYCEDEPALNNNNIIDFNGANSTDSFNVKVRVTGQANNDGTKNVETAVPLKYLRIQ